MKIFVDPQKQLNYHPQVVYFLLKPALYEQYAEHLERLNNYAGFSRNIFKFRAIQRGKKYSSDLSPELIKALGRCNVVVRLLDDQEDNFNYALGKMNFDQSADVFELGLQRFVVDVCKQNAKTLAAQLKEYSADPEEDPEVARVEMNMMTEMVKSFEEAIRLKGFKHGVWGKLLNPIVAVRVCEHLCAIERSIRPMTMDMALNAALPLEIEEARNRVAKALDGHTAKAAFEKMMKFLETKLDILDLQESDQYAQGAADDAQSEALRTDVLSRRKVDQVSDITISIARVAREGKRRRQAQAWGVEVTIGEETIPVYMGSHASTMIYICTLLKVKAGERLNRNVFNRTLPSNKDAAGEVAWLWRVYRWLYPGADTDFSQWYEDMKKNGGHGISQGKAQSVSCIRKDLKERAEAIALCSIQKETQRGRTYYYLNITPDCIQVPEELSAL